MKTPAQKRHGRGEAGISLIETMIALAILLVCSIGILSMAAVSMTTTENQGHLAARTTEYAQDKMEQLLGLSFSDGQFTAGTDTTAIDATTNSYTLGTGGTGLVAGGNLSTTAPAAGYVDYLDANGNPLGGGSNRPANTFFIRLWQITNTTASLKTITVRVAAVSGVNGASSPPSSTVTALKSSPF